MAKVSPNVTPLSQNAITATRKDVDPKDIVNIKYVVIAEEKPEIRGTSKPMRLRMGAKTLEEAEQMLEQIQSMPGGSILFNFRIEKSPIETKE